MSIHKSGREAPLRGRYGSPIYKSVSIYELRRTKSAVVIRPLVRKLLTIVGGGQAVRVDGMMMRLHPAKELAKRLRVERVLAGRFVNFNYQREFSAVEGKLPFVCMWEAPLYHYN